MPKVSSKKSSSFVSVLVLAVLGVATLCDGDENLGYYRYPALHGETIVFVAEGDLWSVGIDGGIARRLTSHPGEETRPFVSPDGTTIAFAAQYEGPTEVYTMPIEGGRPERRTVEAEASVPVGWTPGGKLTYATQHFFNTAGKPTSHD